MIRPDELSDNYHREAGNGTVVSAGKVWEVISAAQNGELDTLRQLINDCSDLAYAQFNYAPPIHFAVREGHAAVVEYLLSLGAHDPFYGIYPFLDRLQVLAKDRSDDEIAEMLDTYEADPGKQKFFGDNGATIIQRPQLHLDFEQAVGNGNLEKVKTILSQEKNIINEPSFFWFEGILAAPANGNNREMVKLLLDHGAEVPPLLKWTQAYHFKHYHMAELLLAHSMSPDTMNYDRVTILHDMAQKGDIPKAELLLDYAANLDLVDEQYQSTPLGMAARWGNTNMVRFLLDKGADIHRSGAPWSTPLAWAANRKFPEIEKLLKDAGAAY